MDSRKIRVAITHGDTNGIGYELIFKAFEDPMMLDLCTPIIYGSPKVAAYHCDALGIDGNAFSIINSAAEAQDGRINLLPVFDEEIKIDLGMPSQEASRAAIKSIDRAITDYKDGLFDVLITGPWTRTICMSTASTSPVMRSSSKAASATERKVSTCLSTACCGWPS